MLNVRPAGGHLYGKQLFTWLSLLVSLMASFCAVPSNFIAGRPKATLLFWFFGGFRCGVPLFIVILVIY